MLEIHADVNKATVGMIYFLFKLRGWIFHLKVWKNWFFSPDVSLGWNIWKICYLQQIVNYQERIPCVEIPNLVFRKHEITGTKYLSNVRTQCLSSENHAVSFNWFEGQLLHYFYRKMIQQSLWEWDQWETSMNDVIGSYETKQDTCNYIFLIFPWGLPGFKMFKNL